MVESDDLLFAYSEKGNRNLDRPAKKRGEKAGKPNVSKEQVTVIATYDKLGNKDFEVAIGGRVNKKDLDKVLKGRLDKIEVLCGDSYRSYNAFAKSLNIKHEKYSASNARPAVEKIYQVQNVNNMEMRLRKFLASFNGVTTTYLQNYLNWFLVLEKIKNSITRITTVAAVAFNSNMA